MNKTNWNLLVDYNTGIKDCFVLKGDRFSDHRGSFREMFHMEQWDRLNIPHQFVQQNIAWSHQFVLRGMHAQIRNPQGKLVSCLEGEVFDVCFDSRPCSPTFMKWFGVQLNPFEMKSLFCPPGTLHGFCVLNGPALVHYFCTSLYDKETDCGVRFDDPAMGIDWPIPSANLIMSEKDKNLPGIGELLKGRL